MTPDSVTARLRDERALRILDVRTPGEFECAHIRGAYNVPLDTLAEHAREIGTVRENRPAVGIPAAACCAD
jgi:rhodanese-related sulfurtransferase